MLTWWFGRMLAWLALVFAMQAKVLFIESVHLWFLLTYSFWSLLPLCQLYFMLLPSIILLAISFSSPTVWTLSVFSTPCRPLRHFTMLPCVGFQRSSLQLVLIYVFGTYPGLTMSGLTFSLDFWLTTITGHSPLTASAPLLLLVSSCRCDGGIVFEHLGRAWTLPCSPSDGPR